MIVSELYCCEIKFPQSSGWQQLVACLHFFSSRVGAGVISEDLLIFCVVLVGAAQLMLENPGWLRFHDPILGADRQRGRLVFLHVAILYPCPVILPAPVSMLGLLLVPLVWYLCTQSESRSSCIKIYLFGHILWLQQSQSQATYGLGEWGCFLVGRSALSYGKYAWKRSREDCISVPFFFYCGKMPTIILAILAIFFSRFMFFFF